MRTAKILLILALICTLTGCSGLTRTQQRVLSGGAIGSGAGAAVAVVTGGSVAAGAVVGAAAGAVGGLIVDEMDKRRR